MVTADVVTDFSAVEKATLGEQGKKGSAAGRFLANDKKEKLNKGRKKKSRPNRPVPQFPWDELSKAGTGIRSLIEQAEKGYLPSSGLEFKYDEVEVVKMCNLDEAYLERLEDECEELCEDFALSDAHELYYEFVMDMIQHYRDNREYWRN